MKRSKKFPSHQQEQFIVRLPDGMRAQLAAHAKKAGRSMNAEIVTRLQSGVVSELRDNFAMLCPFSLIFNCENAPKKITPAMLAAVSFEFADAMLAAREVKS